MKRTLFGLAPVTLALATLVIGCNDDGDPGTDSGNTETAGDGDGDTGDGDGDTGDGDGDEGDGDGDEGDGDGDPGTDSDGDGVSDANDNCPNVANPNQRDFDGNGIGNACDELVFTNISGTLNTSGNVEAGLGGSCSIPLAIMVTGGEVRVQLDDDASVAGFEIVSLEVADLLDKNCALLVMAQVDITDFMLANSGGAFPVTVAHTPEAHDAGSIAGNSNIPHPVLSTGVLEATVNNMAQEPSNLMLDGAVPVFTANISNGGSMGTIAWADPNFVLAKDTFMIDQPLPLDINFELKGLVGSIVLTP